MSELTVFEQLLFSTVKITVEGSGAVSTGTAFFYSINLGNGQQIPLLVTNKHVLAEGAIATIWCHLRHGDGSLKPSGEVMKVTMNIVPGAIIEHPEPSVDLCALPIGNIINENVAAGTPIFLSWLNSRVIPKACDWSEFDAVEEVVMVGCPNGIYDDVNFNPITRRGITATPLGNRDLGKPEFMVDMACFPGSSGSPILLIDKLGHIDRSGGISVGNPRIFFLGILYAGPLITNQGQIVLGRPPQVLTNTMMHLGNAIRASEMLEIEKVILAAL